MLDAIIQHTAGMVDKELCTPGPDGARGEGKHIPPPETPCKDRILESCFKSP